MSAESQNRARNYNKYRLFYNHIFHNLSYLTIINSEKKHMKITSSQLNFLSQCSSEWRGKFENTEVNIMHAECFQHPQLTVDWWSQVNRFSLGWVCVRHIDKLIGFVNVAWDGGAHAFILDTMVQPAFQRQGIARALIAEAVKHAKETGCEWLHVDFTSHLREFYFETCGFTPTDAGLIALN